MISVGNITVGGTGKTPHIEYLIGLLKSKYKVAVISRGYKRKTKGFILADSESNANAIGDEPFQYYSKFNSQIHVAVGEKRAVAIPHLLALKPETQVILLDDAFQHRGVKPHLNILLIDFNRLIFNDFMLPSGYLREPITGVNRADIIVFTKCPEEIGYKKEYVKLKLAKYITNKWKPVFFTNFKYGNPIQFSGENQEINDFDSVVLVSALAQNQPFFDAINQNYNVIHHFEFADHYEYPISSIEKIINYYHNSKNENICILMTEKDMVKWKNPNIEEKLKHIPCYFIPIEVNFLENESQFQKMIFKTVDNIS